MTTYNTLIKEHNKNKDDIVGINSQLADIEKQTINPISYGVTGVEVGDVRDKVQNVLNQSVSRNQKKVIFPKGHYQLANTLNISVDDLEVDFQGSTIEWIGSLPSTTMQRNLRHIGVFNIKGTLHVDSVVEITSLAKDNLDNNFVITVTDTTNYIVGDFVRIDINCGHSGTIDGGVLYPELNQMCQIVKITGNDITINITNDFDYSKKNGGRWYNTGDLITNVFYPISTTNTNCYGAKLWKVTPVKNVVIKNFNFLDSQSYNEGVTDVSTCVAGISTFYCYNLKVENVKGSHMKFPLVVNRLCQSSRFININGKNADSVNAGMGYVVQTIHSNDIEYNTITGNDVRHTVDFSSVLNGRMINCHDYNNLRDNSGIAIHGMCEYNIKLENCTANRISIGHGIDSFPCMMDKFEIINCDFELQCNNTNFATNFLFQKCNIGNWSAFISLGNSTFYNCKINKSKNINLLKSYWDMMRRGYIGDLNLTFDNCNIDYKSHPRLYFVWQNKLKFINCNIKLPLTLLDINGVNDINFIDSDIQINTSKLWINGTEFLNDNNPSNAIINFNFINNKLVKDSSIQDIRRFGFGEIPNCKVTSDICNNSLLYNKGDVSASVDSLTLGFISHGFDMSIDSRTTNYTGANIVSKFNDNVMQSNNKEGVAHYIAENIAFAITKMAKNNIIKNATTFDVCDITNNIKS